jgi:hypothetical protein
MTIFQIIIVNGQYGGQADEQNALDHCCGAQSDVCADNLSLSAAVTCQSIQSGGAVVSL